MTVHKELKLAVDELKLGCSSLDRVHWVEGVQIEKHFVPLCEQLVLFVPPEEVGMMRITRAS